MPGRSAGAAPDSPEALQHPESRAAQPRCHRNRVAALEAEVVDARRLPATRGDADADDLATVAADDGAGALQGERVPAEGDVDPRTGLEQSQEFGEDAED